jgi:hypothetical protein
VIEWRQEHAWRTAVDSQRADPISTSAVEYVGILVKLQTSLLAYDAVSDIFPIGYLIGSTPKNDNHRDIGGAPIFEIAGLEQVFKAFIVLADILSALGRFDLNAEQLAERRTTLGIAQLDDAVGARFKTATRS